ncbi:MAG TPA: RIP metalloprotease RseP [Clostridia bacterium]|nr:RIP metalloprotease RseP [Clostridia bacterium]
MTTFLASIFVFGLLIFIHELGHFAIAKRVGIKVHEFSLGFGPNLLGVNKGGTQYSLRLLPLGGFVRMAGMEPGEEGVERHRAFYGKSVLERAAVLFAGPLMNFVLAVILLGLVFMFQGVPSPSTVIDEVMPGTPADRAGILAGDKLIAVDGVVMDSWQEFTVLVNSHPGQLLNIEVERTGSNLSFDVAPEKDETGRGIIGVVTRVQSVKLNTPAALLAGASYTGQITLLIFTFIGQMITQQAPVDLAGPVGIVSEIGSAAKLGIWQLLQLAAFLSINLGILNLLPVPALDGGRLLFLGVEAVRGRPVDPNKENFFHLLGFALLLVLIVVITYSDILNLVYK